MSVRRLQSGWSASATVLPFIPIGIIGVALTLGLVWAGLSVFWLATVFLWSVALVLLPGTLSLGLIILAAPIRIYGSIPGLQAEISLTTLVLVGIAVILCVNQLLNGRLALTRWEWSIVAWWVWICVSVLWSSDRAASVRGVVQWTLFFGMIAITALSFLRASDPEAMARSVVRAVLALMVFWALMGFVEVALGRDAVLLALQSPFSAVVFPQNLLSSKFFLMDFNWLRGNAVQPFGPFVNSISFGIFTAVGIGAAAAVLTSRTKLVSRPIAVICLLALLAVNVATLKATGWMAAAGALITLHLALGGSFRRAAVGLFATALLVGVSAYLFRGMIVERVLSLTAREGVSSQAVDAISRAAAWRHYAGVAAQRPVLGRGLFTAVRFGPVRFTTSGAGGTTATRLPPENGYLTTVVEQGVPGLLMLLLLLGGAVRRGVRLARGRPNDALSAAAGLAAVCLVAYMVGNVTVSEFSEETSSILCGLFIGIIVAASRLATPPQSMQNP